MKTHVKLNTMKICTKKGINQTGFIRLMDAQGISRNTAIKVFHEEPNVMLPVIAAAVTALDVSFDEMVEFT